MAYLAAADDHNALYLALEQFELAEECVDIVGCAHDGHTVSRFKYEITAGDVKCLGPDDCGDQNFQLILHSDLYQVHSHQRIVVIELELHHFDPAAGKGGDLEGGGVAKHTGYLCGGLKLGVDGHTEPQIVFEKIHLRCIFGISYTCDGVSYAQIFCNEASQQIALVQTCSGNKQVGLVHTRLFLYIDRCTVAQQSHNVVSFGILSESVGVAVYDHYIVVLARKLLYKHGAYLSGSHYGNFHPNTPLCVIW